MLKKALALLKPHEEYFEDDYYWNFRMGYSYFYLDQEGRALRYFEKALEARPGDEDTMELIDWCRKGISLPQFSECFRERTENCWETFVLIHQCEFRVVTGIKTLVTEYTANLVYTFHTTYDQAVRQQDHLRHISTH